MADQVQGIDLTSETSRFNSAKYVHDTLENALLERTFFDTHMKEEAKEEANEEVKINE